MMKYTSTIFLSMITFWSLNEPAEYQHYQHDHFKALGQRHYVRFPPTLVTLVGNYSFERLVWERESSQDWSATVATSREPLTADSWSSYALSVVCSLLSHRLLSGNSILWLFVQCFTCWKASWHFWLIWQVTWKHLRIVAKLTTTYFGRLNHLC